MGCDFYKQYLASEPPVDESGYVTASREFLLGDALTKEALGVYMFVDFLSGSKVIDRQQGYLAAVGIDYIILYNPTKDMYVYGSLYSVKFIYYVNQVDYSVVLAWERKLNGDII